MPNLSALPSRIAGLLSPLGVRVITGYPKLLDRPPYVVIRLQDWSSSLPSIAGVELCQQVDLMIYCTGASIEASSSLGDAVVNQLQGLRILGQIPRMAISYPEEEVEGSFQTVVSFSLGGDPL